MCSFGKISVNLTALLVPIHDTSDELALYVGANVFVFFLNMNRTCVYVGRVDHEKPSAESGLIEQFLRKARVAVEVDFLMPASG